MGGAIPSNPLRKAFDSEVSFKNPSPAAGPAETLQHKTISRPNPEEILEIVKSNLGSARTLLWGTTSTGRQLVITRKRSIYVSVAHLGTGRSKITYLAMKLGTAVDQPFQEVALNQQKLKSLGMAKEGAKLPVSQYELDLHGFLSVLCKQAKREGRDNPLTHVAIAKVIDCPSTGNHALWGTPYPGDNVEDCLRAGNLTESERKAICEGLLRALEELHRQGILHRDVKSDNILLVKDRELPKEEWPANISTERIPEGYSILVDNGKIVSVKESSMPFFAI